MHASCMYLLAAQGLWFGNSGLSAPGFGFGVQGRVCGSFSFRTLEDPMKDIERSPGIPKPH